MSDQLGAKLTRLAEGVLDDLLKKRAQAAPGDDVEDRVSQELVALKAIGTLYLGLKKHDITADDMGDSAVSMQSMRKRLKEASERGNGADTAAGG